MQLVDLKSKYDELQLQYGAPELMSIYNGGCASRPNICFIFMNPTGRNIASDPNWNGKKSPWIGTKNIWKLFYKINLLDKEIYENIMTKEPHEWDEIFADLVYSNVEKYKFFITNLGKCTQVDVRVLPKSVYSKCLDLLCKEIEIANPKIIIIFGNQVSSILLNRNISVSQCRKQFFSKNIAGKDYKVYPVYCPIGNGMLHLDKALDDLRFIIKENFTCNKDRVYEYLLTIPIGKVVTYGQIAKYLGNKNLSRVVGNILHNNPNEHKYPCYKVVNSNGELSKNFAFGGITGQKQKLESENIEVKNNKVDLERYQWNV